MALFIYLFIYLFIFLKTSTPPERRRRPPLQRARSAHAVRTQRAPACLTALAMAPNGALRRRQRLKRASSALEMRLNRSPKPHLQQGCLIRASMAREGAGMVRL